MMRPSTEIRIEAATVTDRGLNERRPLNEDSYLSDVERRVFVVADGVGGAEAGEVASETAVEVLAKAFENQRDGEDVEDLMEIAIQRANDAIHRMAREDPKFSMMATTIVVLHLDGLRATVGHVGDSRLYRVTPDGRIWRETEDHSVVEEEVRAGRMTPEQAQNHPSRNVISRALGAEPDVEVDLKTFEVEPGTCFLLCTDGITRHIPDGELRAVVSGSPSLDAACQEMKRLCFERGAEDNLTAVLVRVGDSPNEFEETLEGWDGEQTLIAEKRSTGGANGAAVAPPAGRNDARASSDGVAAAAAYQPPAASQPDGRGDEDADGWRGARPASAPTMPMQTTQATMTTQPPPQQPPPPRPTAKRGVGAGAVFFMLLLVLAFSGAAFYAGMFFEGQRRAPATANANLSATPSPVQAVRAGSVGNYEAERSRVDSAFLTESERRGADLAAQPSKADDPEFLYFYGRALLLSNRAPDAAVQFEKAMSIIRQQGKSSQMSLLLDSQLALATAQLRALNPDGAKRTADALGQLDPAAGFGAAAPAAAGAAMPTPFPTAQPSPPGQF